MAKTYPEYGIRLEPIRDPLSSPNEKDIGQRSKLGGVPTWIQSDETPSCQECREPMSFIAQLDSIDADFRFGDEGILYVFYCDFCHNAQAFEQCY